MSNIDIAYFAKLSHIRLTDEELPELQQNIENILESFADFPDFSDINLEPDLANPIRFREDTAIKSLSQEEALSNAPKQSGGCVVIPKTVE